MKLRLIIMNFLQFAVWGAYLTSMGNYLGNAGLGANIGVFYSIQGVVSIFMPALMGIVADRWIPAQKLLGICHGIAGALMIAAGWYGLTTDAVQFSTLFTLYSLSVAFYMPTLALSNSVAYNALDKAGLDTVKAFPPIRVFGTIGFICTMWVVNLLGFKEDISWATITVFDKESISFQSTAAQYVISGGLGLILAIYSFTLPECPISKNSGEKTLVEALGLNAFALFKEYRMAIFFIFSMLLGMMLQITNGYANPFISSFGAFPEYANTFGVQYANILISLSQISETLCILLITFFFKLFGIKNVMLMAMLAWMLRFGFFGMGNPGSGVWLFILSMIVYGMAFDFFNISGSLFVDKEVNSNMRSSAQGLFMMMTNGFGATIGVLAAQAIVNHYCQYNATGHLVGDWTTVWYIFAGFALIVAIAFALIFREKKNNNI